MKVKCDDVVERKYIFSKFRFILNLSQSNSPVLIFEALLPASGFLSPRPPIFSCRDPDLTRTGETAPPPCPRSVSINVYQMCIKYTIFGPRPSLTFSFLQRSSNIISKDTVSGSRASAGVMMRALLSDGGGGGAMPLCRDMLPLTFNYNYAMALEIILFCKMKSPIYGQSL